MRCGVAILFAAIVQLAVASEPGDGPKVIINVSKIRPLVSSPLPQYPKEAVKNHWGGFGIFEVHFRQTDGTASAVFVLLSTNHKILDDAAKTALMRWRCWSGNTRVAMVPVTFAAGKQK